MYQFKSYVCVQSVREILESEDQEKNIDLVITLEDWIGKV